MLLNAVHHILMTVIALHNFHGFFWGFPEKHFNKDFWIFTCSFHKLSHNILHKCSQFLKHMFWHQISSTNATKKKTFSQTENSVQTQIIRFQRKTCKISPSDEHISEILQKLQIKDLLVTLYVYGLMYWPRLTSK